MSYLRKQDNLFYEGHCAKFLGTRQWNTTEEDIFYIVEVIMSSGATDRITRPRASFKLVTLLSLRQGLKNVKYILLQYEIRPHNSPYILDHSFRKLFRLASLVLRESSYGSTMLSAIIPEKGSYVSKNT